MEPEKAVTWVLSLPDPPEQQTALDNTIRTWTITGPDKLQKWIALQPPGPDGDAFRVTASGVQEETDPKAALALASAITDPAAQTDQLVSVLRRWQSDDPAGAAAILPGLTLPAEAARRLKLH
jgi:hypothetical protein